mmetsp:Transcript_69446/g.144831  ORF Transcript_69446/g.144831 Transcript_69446/m.144831 type:complete len:131 (+) Transcript_69446:1082-1474(+)
MNQEIQKIHNAWGHPCNSTLEWICRHYKRGFPQDFLHRLRNFSCKFCTLVIVADCCSFTWAASTKRCIKPEELLDEFLELTGIQVSTIWYDGAASLTTQLRSWHGARNTTSPAAPSLHTLTPSTHALKVL